MAKNIRDAMKSAQQSRNNLSRDSANGHVKTNTSVRARNISKLVTDEISERQSATQKQQQQSNMTSSNAQNTLSSQPADDFSSLFNDVKPVKHDKYVPDARKSTLLTKQEKLANAKKRFGTDAKVRKRQQASIALSDNYEAHWPENKPIKFIREQAGAYRQNERTKQLDVKHLQKDLLKQLSMAKIPPDIEVDLHGLNAKQAKAELIAVVYEAKKQHYSCINIIHGHGGGTLKRKVPNWLVQHPDVTGFVQAPRAYGGKAGLLVLIDIDFENYKHES